MILLENIQIVERYPSGEPLHKKVCLLIECQRLKVGNGVQASIEKYIRTYRDIILSYRHGRAV